MIPATISTMLSTTSPVTARPKISAHNKNPPLGGSASTWPATAAGIIVSTLLLRRSPADLPALRAIAAFCPPHRGLLENFDWDAPLRFVHKSAGLSDRVLAGIGALRSRTTGVWHKS